MQSYYDITNPDAAYEWLYSVLDMKRGDFISDYVLESRDDFDTFFERHLKEAERLDIDQEIVGHQMISMASPYTPNLYSSFTALS